MGREIVLFDIDDTLFNTTNFLIAGYNAPLHLLSKLMKKEGYDIKFEKLRLKFDEEYGKSKNSDKLFEKTLRHFDIEDKDIDYYIAVAKQEFGIMKSMMRPCQDVKKVLKVLKKRGFIIGIASKGIAEKQWEKLIRIGVADFFDRKNCFFTLNKDKSFYEGIKNKLNMQDFQDMWMIGDKEEDDIIFSKEVGFKNVRIYSYRQQDDFGKSIADFKVTRLKEVLEFIV